jgi:hypothetical protein
MSNNKYLQIEFSTGNLFEFSKAEKEGFEQHKSTKGTISFRKYYKEGIFGIYRGSSIRETDFGKEVSIHLVDNDGINNYINMPLFDQKKNIAAYAESFIGVLPSLEANYVYRVFPYSMDKKNSEYKSYGVSVKHADMETKSVREDYPLQRLTYTIVNKEGEVKEGDIPAIKWEENFDGTKVKNTFERNKYLYQVLEKHATGSTKMPQVAKVTGGEPPKPYTQGESKATAPKENTVVYTQEFNKPTENVEEVKPAPVQEVSNKNVKSELPF